MHRPLSRLGHVAGSFRQRPDLVANRGLRLYSLHAVGKARCRVLSCRRRPYMALQTRRSISNETTSYLSQMPSVLVVPSVLIGLTLSLWTFKCASLVAFQNKIIYMPSLPPYSRSEKLEDYQSDCGQVVWREESTFSTDGKKLALAIGDIDYEKLKQGSSTESGRRLVVLYFQGNGSSTPPRLPLLSRVVTAISQKNHRSVTLAALSYRGYWNSTGQPSQAGIEDDAQSFFSWASRTYPGADIVIWGQSIGSGIATTALAALYETSSASKINVARVILETPFVNMRRMLADLYPQKWLPYRHLWPFLRSAWDSEKALRRLEASGKRVPPILLLPATDDEVVPSAEADWLEDLCKVLRLHYRRVDVDGALHNEASTKLRGRQAIANFVHDPMSK